MVILYAVYIAYTTAAKVNDQQKEQIAAAGTMEKVSNIVGH